MPETPKYDTGQIIPDRPKDNPWRKKSSSMG